MRRSLERTNPNEVRGAARVVLNRRPEQHDVLWIGANGDVSSTYWNPGALNPGRRPRAALSLRRCDGCGNAAFTEMRSSAASASAHLYECVVPEGRRAPHSDKCAVPSLWRQPAGSHRPEDRSTVPLHGGGERMSALPRRPTYRGPRWGASRRCLLAGGPGPRGRCSLADCFSPAGACGATAGRRARAAGGRSGSAARPPRCGPRRAS